MICGSMRSHIIDLILSFLLLGVISYRLQTKPTLQDDIPLQNENQEFFLPDDLSIIHFWAPWSKPSLRQLQLFHRFTKTHPDIQLIAVHSHLENLASVTSLKQEKGWPFSLAQTTEFPERLPYTILITKDQKIVFDKAIYYEQLLEIFERDH